MIVCVPDCEGKQCGDDGCSGVCGICTTEGQECIDGTCKTPEEPPDCVPSCDGKQCGSDGCGGNCGQCTTGLCQGGQCLGGANCVPDAELVCVDGQVWNADSCGNATSLAEDCGHGCQDGKCLLEVGSTVSTETTGCSGTGTGTGTGTFWLLVVVGFAVVRRSADTG